MGLGLLKRLGRKVGQAETEQIGQGHGGAPLLSTCLNEGRVFFPHNSCCHQRATLKGVVIRGGPTRIPASSTHFGNSISSGAAKAFLHTPWGCYKYISEQLEKLLLLLSKHH